MSSRDRALRVAVAGGGLGGLCLAQHLKAEGVDVVVYERDGSLDSRGQGYRIHLDARAGSALGASLSADLYGLFTRTCGRPGTGMTVLSERLRRLHHEPAMSDLDARRFEEFDAEQLHEVALKMIDKWHPSLLALVEQAAPDECFAVRIRHSTPVPAWPSSRVTVLGDAIHAMSPARGSGANTALRDAAELGSRLVTAARGDRTLLSAVGGYESTMRGYGYEAVRVSAEAERTTAARRSSLLRRLVTRLPARS